MMSRCSHIALNLKKRVRIVISNAFNLPVNGRGEVSFSSKCSRMYLLNYRLSDAFSVGVTHFIWALLTLQREPEISLRLFYSIFVKFIDHSFPQNGLRNGDQWCLQFFFVNIVFFQETNQHNLQLRAFNIILSFDFDAAVCGYCGKESKMSAASF